MASNTLTITDNRTGKAYEVPISDGTIRATELRKIKTNDDDFGLMTYDPAFMNTAACRSAITFIDGDKGILEYRGYPIEQLAENSTYLETAYLVIYGELPTKAQLDDWAHNITYKTTELKYKPNPALERALEVLFILHADHEQNCSTAVMRSVGSSHVDPYSCVAAAAAALYGPLHGGANEQVIRMLTEIGSIDHIPEFIKKVKAGEGVKLMGFGHRVYKNYDPRAKIIKDVAYEVFEVTGKNPLLDIALELERIALEDEYFVKRKLYPNVDFYSGIIYQAMSFPVDMFPVLFAIPRTSGWIAQWVELLNDPEQKIARPRQVYLGQRTRQYVPLAQRDGAVAQTAGS